MSSSAISVVAIIMSLLIPIVGIIFGCMVAIRQKQNDTELRRLLIENKTDIETAKAIMEEQEKKSDKYTSLRAACVLIGVGLGALADYLFNIQGIFFWLVIAFGVGIGLLASFIAEQKLQEREHKEDE